MQITIRLGHYNHNNAVTASAYFYNDKGVRLCSSKIGDTSYLPGLTYLILLHVEAAMEVYRTLRPDAPVQLVISKEARKLLSDREVDELLTLVPGRVEHI